MGSLYLATGPSGKQYVGITLRDVPSRWAEHVKTSGRGISAIGAAIVKYGASAFRVETLVIADAWDFLCALERKVILSYATKAPHGYNLTSGGDGAQGMCEEARKRHSANTSKGTYKSWKSQKARDSHALSRARPEYKAKQAARTRNANLWGMADYRDRTLKARNTPEYRAKVANFVKALWQNDAYRSNQVKRRNSREPRSIESKLRQSEKMRELIAARKAAGTYWR
jgi:hypothetical protein